ncbi:MAG: transposase [Desulfobacteraceae bacterium]|nr:transposase [Desulfobacteraceae bacterium]
MEKLSKCAFKVIRAYPAHAVPGNNAVPGVSIAIQTYGDFLNSNPHLHAIVSDGCFLDGNSFEVAPELMGQDLEEAFQYEVLKMLKKEGKISDAIIENMLSWRHSGFHVYLGSTIWPDDEEGLENLVRYIIRACFSRQRMVYIPKEDASDGIAEVIYSSKNGQSQNTFDAVDWQAQLDGACTGKI